MENLPDRVRVHCVPVTGPIDPVVLLSHVVCRWWYQGVVLGWN